MPNCTSQRLQMLLQILCRFFNRFHYDQHFYCKSKKYLIHVSHPCLRYKKKIQIEFDKWMHRDNFVEKSHYIYK